MRTGMFMLAGLLLLAASLGLTGFKMWVGVATAGYSATEELPILLLPFGVPALAAVLLKWKLV